MSTHQFFKDHWADYLPSFELGHEQLEAFRDAVHVANEDPSPKKTADRDAKRSAMLETIDLWAGYVALRAVAEKNPTLIDDSGFKRKVRMKNSKVISAVAPTGVSVKDASIPGAVMVKCDKMGSNITYEVQAILGDTADEKSPVSAFHFASCRRMEVKGLEVANRYNIRVRYHTTEGPGPWSPFLPVIVT